MQRQDSLLPRLAIAGLALATLMPLASAQDFVIANRGSSNLSVFDRDGKLRRTVTIPAGTKAAEPMYVVQVGAEVVVGDRANNRIVRFSKNNWKMTGHVAVGKGVFHMWAGHRGTVRETV